MRTSIVRVVKITHTVVKLKNGKLVLKKIKA